MASVIKGNGKGGVTGIWATARSCAGHYWCADGPFSALSPKRRWGEAGHLLGCWTVQGMQSR